LKKNPFKEILTQQEVPTEVKKNIMDEIASISLAFELTDLFTVKLTSVLESLFTENKKRK
jgi:hypothetical protein